jgi:hypothetical protein
MKELENEIKNVKHRYSVWASVYYHITSYEFKIIYEKANPEDRIQLLNCIHEGKIGFLKDYIKKHKENLQAFDKMSLRKLRDIAKHLRINDWYTMNKGELIKEVRNEVERIKADSEQLIN